MSLDLSCCSLLVFFGCYLLSIEDMNSGPFTSVIHSVLSIIISINDFRPGLKAKANVSLELGATV
ncbi:hypothetical protein M8C21_016672 [Ambrosia artemisiifolia]|uniref:Uncharacterized protein n=1 Tax=Ambrosia artemisiifolia TaxID=4212 RepID=A0AAD5C6T8_AMBAR|nr:hypothetical protein M8C21_016672 [Ambrosia artemisiifolia]